jgi:hypothetical protein
MEAMMRKLLIIAIVVLALVAGTSADIQAKADEHAPCIGQNASTFTPALRGDFGQQVIKPEATSGETGEVASGAARRQTDCTP